MKDRRPNVAQWARSAENVKKPQIDVKVMDMGHNDSNNVFSKNLGTFFKLFTVHWAHIDSEGRFLYKTRRSGPWCVVCRRRRPAADRKKGIQQITSTRDFFTPTKLRHSPCLHCSHKRPSNTAAQHWKLGLYGSFSSNWEFLAFPPFFRVKWTCTVHRVVFFLTTHEETPAISRITLTNVVFDD